jgi:hypothetical protein
MFKKVILGAVAVAAVNATAFAGAGVFLDDEAGWLASADGTVVTPDYTTVAPVDFSPGVPTDLGGFYDVLATGGGPGSASLNGVPNFVFDFSPGGLSSVTFTFDTPITGFSGIWSNTFVQDGFQVSTPFADYDLGAISGNDLSARFIGIHEAAPFSTVTFSTASPVGGDDFVFFNSFNFVEIPAPGAVALLSVAGLVGTRRRR